ncbi:inorganic phosphate transporter family protein [bacterium]|nr:inorganic phosphate transporter family protein [bacterium]
MFLFSLSYLKLLGGIYLGWSLGANNTANVFGTAVSSGMVKFRTATVFFVVFVILGAVIGGAPGIKTLGGLTSQNINTAFVISVAAAVAVTLLTMLKLPASVSQAVVGAILGIGILQKQINSAGLQKVVICWICTPVGAAVIAILLYMFLTYILRKIDIHFLDFDRIVRIMLILSGAYGAYALGANNVANITGVYCQAGILTPFLAALIGSISIALGAVTYSRNVMMTVGKSIIPLNAFCALVVVLSEAITVDIFAHIGVPVSTCQAVIGGVIGVGVVRNIKAVNFKVLYKIFSGWMVTPVISCVLSYVLYKIFYM